MQMRVQLGRGRVWQLSHVTTWWPLIDLWVTPTPYRLCGATCLTWKSHSTWENISPTFNTVATSIEFNFIRFINSFNLMQFHELNSTSFIQFHWFNLMPFWWMDLIQLITFNFIDWITLIQFHIGMLNWIGSDRFAISSNVIEISNRMKSGPI